ncbi:hypothetical protein [Nitratireductor sp. ZSWI3]|uniref:hypothetical protein n=1 Tax=Nitratireductor sp. ZSWI3 TaxID=2966359 RepID=UPI0021505CE1|nr:hypothetical protein [Nitratireductor sp. ZSWI3]MCR4264698.1 hypothetical protein [Nitratireductor sp. ZSWI3]
MRKLADEEVEGRLNAQREAIALLFALLARQGASGDVVGLLEERAAFSDHQEDPGAVPADGFAAQEARAREFECMAKEVSALVRAGAVQRAAETHES